MLDGKLMKSQKHQDKIALRLQLAHWLRELKAKGVDKSNPGLYQDLAVRFYLLDRELDANEKK